MGHDPKTMFPGGIYTGYPTQPLGCGMTADRVYTPFGNGFYDAISVRRFRHAPFLVAIRGMMAPKGGESFSFDTTVVADSRRVLQFPRTSGTLTITVRRKRSQDNALRKAKNLGENDTLAIRRHVSDNVTKSYEDCTRELADFEIEMETSIPSQSLSFHKTFYRRFVRKTFTDSALEFDLAPESQSGSIRTIPLSTTRRPTIHNASVHRDSEQWGNLTADCDLTPLMGDSVGFWLMVYGNLTADTATIDWEERFGVAQDTTLHWKTSKLRIAARIRFLHDAKRSKPQGTLGAGIRETQRALWRGAHGIRGHRWPKALRSKRHDGSEASSLPTSLPPHHDAGIFPQSHQKNQSRLFSSEAARFSMVSTPWSTMS